MTQCISIYLKKSLGFHFFLFIFLQTKMDENCIRNQMAKCNGHKKKFIYTKTSIVCMCNCQLWCKQVEVTKPNGGCVSIKRSAYTFIVKIIITTSARSRASQFQIVAVFFIDVCCCCCVFKCLFAPFVFGHLHLICFFFLVVFVVFFVVVVYYCYCCLHNIIKFKFCTVTFKRVLFVLPA